MEGPGSKKIKNLNILQWQKQITNKNEWRKIVYQA